MMSASQRLAFLLLLYVSPPPPCTGGGGYSRQWTAAASRAHNGDNEMDFRTLEFVTGMLIFYQTNHGQME